MSTMDDLRTIINPEKEQKKVETRQSLEAAAPLIKQQVEEVPELSAQEKEQVKRNIDIKSVDPDIELPEEESENGVGISKQFTEALTFFAPQILGAGLGAIFGGTEAAASGLEAGGQARDAFITNQLQQEELNLKKRALEDKKRKELLRAQAPDIDIKSFVDKEGNPVRFNENTNLFTDFTGKPVDPRNIKRTNLFKQDRSLEQKEKQMSQVQKRFNLKNAELSDKQTEDLRGIVKTQDLINQISLQNEGVDTGPFATFFQSTGEKLDLASPEFTALKQKVGTLNNDYIKMITGAQMSEPEAKRIMQAMPSIYDDDETFKTKVKVLKEVINTQEKAFANAIATGQPLKGEANKAIRQILDKHGIAASATGKKEITEEDIDKMSAKELREFLGGQ